MPDSDVTYCNSRLQGRADDVPKKDPGPEHHGDGYCERMTDGGRCRYHGKHAGRPAEHGLRSELREDLRRYVEQAASMDAPGDLKGELAVLRGLLFDYLDDKEQLDKSDITAAHKLLSEIRRTSDTLHKQLTREKLTREEMRRAARAIGSVVKQYVPEDQHQAVVDEIESVVSEITSRKGL